MPIHRALIHSLTEVFRDVRYIGIALGFGFIAFAISLWLHNINLINSALFSPLFSISDNALLLLRLLGGITTNVTPLMAVLIVVMAAVFGINAALLIYSFSHKQKLSGVYTAGSMAGGIVSALFGAGCASCGTYLLGATLASFGVSGMLAFLPLGGQELLIVSIGLLAASTVWLAKSMQAAKVCTVVQPSQSNSY